jgi:hypothetical protein
MILIPFLARAYIVNSQTSDKYKPIKEKKREELALRDVFAAKSLYQLIQNTWVW